MAKARLALSCPLNPFPQPTKLTRSNGPMLETVDRICAAYFQTLLALRPGALQREQVEEVAL